MIALLLMSIAVLAHMYMPSLEDRLTTPDGEPGWLCIFYTHDEAGNPKDEVSRFVLQDTRVKLNDFMPEGLGDTWTMKLRGILSVERSGPFDFGLSVAGRAKLFVNNKLVVDNWTRQRPGGLFYGQGTVEEKGTADLIANTPVEVLVEYTNTPPPDAGIRDNSNLAVIIGMVCDSPLLGLMVEGIDKLPRSDWVEQRRLIRRLNSISQFSLLLNPMSSLSWAG